MQVRLNILRQTEKAVEVISNYYGISRVSQHTVWLPKSQIKIEDNTVVDVAEWLVKKLKDQYGMQAPYWCAKEQGIEFAI